MQADDSALVAETRELAPDAAATADDAPAYGRNAPISHRAMFGVLFAVLLGYLISLFARPVSDSHVWLDGWGVAAFELLVSLLILARGLVDNVRGDTRS